MLSLAFRNVFRNKRRTIITLLSVIFAAFLINTMRFMAYGMHQQALSNAINLNSGFIQIASFGWLENKPITRALDVDNRLLKKIQVKEVNSISPRIESHALASHKKNSVFVSILAADANLEKKITTLHQKPVRGKFLHQLETIQKIDQEGRPVYFANIGHTLANNLDAELESTIALVSSQFDGSVGALLIQIKGIFRTSDGHIDANQVYLPLEAGFSLYGLLNTPEKKQYTSIALGISDYLQAEQAYAKLEKALPRPELAHDQNPEDSDLFDPVVNFWPRLIPGLYQMMQFDDLQNEATLAFLILIMAFGILNTVQMSIQERTRELGVLIALGTRRMQLMFMMVVETLCILLPGLALGSLGAIWLGDYLYHNPIELAKELTEAYAAFGMQSINIMAIVNLEQLYIGLASLFLPSVLLALLAMRRVFKIEPVEVISAQ